MVEVETSKSKEKDKSKLKEKGRSMVLVHFNVQMDGGDLFKMRSKSIKMREVKVEVEELDKVGRGRDRTR